MEVIHIEINDRNQIEENLKAVLSLEYYGIHIEDTKEQDLKILYYFSVPEKSTMEIDNALNDKIKTADGLIKIAKESLTQIIINSCKAEFDDEEEDEEFYNDVKNNISDYALFYAKVRKGEIWNEEMGKAAIQKVINEIKNNSYKKL